MTKLSDTQLLILNAAAQRENRIALPLPSSLRGGAATKVVSAMIAKSLIEEVDADLSKGGPVWREVGDGHGVTLVITDAGLAAIGVDLEAGPKADPQQERCEDHARSEPATKAQARAMRPGTKQAALIELLRQESGATIEQMAAATGWQAHTVRGAMAGALKKKLGLTITSEKVDGRGRVYRIASA